jgi:hypothetical protein
MLTINTTSNKGLNGHEFSNAAEAPVPRRGAQLESDSCFGFRGTLRSRPGNLNNNICYANEWIFVWLRWHDIRVLIPGAAYAGRLEHSEA